MFHQDLMLKQMPVSVRVNIHLYKPYVPDIPYLANTSIPLSYIETPPSTYEDLHRNLLLRYKSDNKTGPHKKYLMVLIKLMNTHSQSGRNK